MDQLEADESDNCNDNWKSGSKSPGHQSTEEEHTGEAEGVGQQPEGGCQASKVGVADFANERLNDHACNNVANA